MKPRPLWGCGAIGGHVAEWVARAGATKLLLVDDDIVTPGVLVRQPYTYADIGSPKARALAQRLRAIAPATQLEPRVGSVLDFPPGDGAWHGEADVIIDATCSHAVRAKLEELRRRDRRSGTTLISILLGRTAQRAIAVIAPPGYSGGVADVLRQAKLRCVAGAHLRGFADEFWPPQPRAEQFQPEARSSTARFRGAGAEVVALTATLLRQISSVLADHPHAADASAQLVVLPDVEHQGVRAASLRFSPATVLQDGVGAYEFRVAPAALADVRAWTARNDRELNPALQTGGVLYGRRDVASRIVWIDSVTGPPPGSHASPTEFVCGTGRGVADSSHERLGCSRGELQHLGIWHTHPRMTPAASLKDLGAMLNLIAAEPIREGVLLIVGDAAARLAGYVISADALQRDDRHRSS
jgi:molybdopterin/thiamine biosynthesis adenylyltransferase